MPSSVATDSAPVSTMTTAVIVGVGGIAAAIADEFARREIRVFTRGQLPAAKAVRGGPVDTLTLRSMLDTGQKAQLSRDVESRTLARRLARPDDTADVVAILCTPHSRWICGQVILADGGKEILRG